MALAVVVAFGQSEFTVNDLINVKRVGSPAVSPDGKKIVYTVGIVDKSTNKTNTQIFVMSADGSDQKQITNGPASSSGPVWSPNGKRIAFVTGGQIWTMKANGDDKDQVTKISTGASAPVWSPNGKWIAFSSDVYPECATDECNRTEDEKAENSKVKAHVSTRLLYRHWVEWRDRKRTHVFVVDSDGGKVLEMLRRETSIHRRTQPLLAVISSFLPIAPQLSICEILTRSKRSLPTAISLSQT